MKDILLSITGKTITFDLYDEKTEDVIEFITQGNLYENPTALYFVYP